MPYRNGTYVAFDALGQTDPTKSDFRYYSTINAWSAGQNIEFRYVDSHSKTSAVRDSSTRATLEARIRERFAASKNCLIILSSKTRKSGSMLSYEIEKAVDYYKIPLIIAYPDYEYIDKPKDLSGRWPNELSQRISNGTAKAIHIPFKKGAILGAIEQFTIQKGGLKGPLHCYSRQAHIDMGCIES